MKTLCLSVVKLSNKTSNQVVLLFQINCDFVIEK